MDKTNYLRKILLYILLGAILLTSLGCLNLPPETYSFYYRPKTQYVGIKTFPVSVAIKPFIDKRPLHQKKPKRGLLWIPLVPYVKGECSTPDLKCSGFPPHSIHPSVDFAQALVSDLRSSSLFKDVVYLENKDIVDNQLLLQGTIISTNTISRDTFYGLGPGLIAYLFLPKSFYVNEVKLYICLVRPETGDVIWQNTYREESRQTDVGMFRTERCFAGFPEIIEKIDRDIIRSLEKDLLTRPIEFRKPEKS